MIRMDFVREINCSQCVSQLSSLLSITQARDLDAFHVPLTHSHARTLTRSRLRTFISPAFHASPMDPSSAVFVHFIPLPLRDPGKKDLPWIVHVCDGSGCTSFKHVCFRSLAGFETFEGTPPEQKCSCVISSHHLRGFGKVTVQGQTAVIESDDTEDAMINAPAYREEAKQRKQQAQAAKQQLMRERQLREEERSEMQSLYAKMRVAQRTITAHKHNEHEKQRSEMLADYERMKQEHAAMKIEREALKAEVRQLRSEKQLRINNVEPRLGSPRQAPPPALHWQTSHVAGFRVLRLKDASGSQCTSWSEELQHASPDAETQSGQPRPKLGGWERAGDVPTSFREHVDRVLKQKAAASRAVDGDATVPATAIDAVAASWPALPVLPSPQGLPKGPLAGRALGHR